MNSAKYIADRIRLMIATKQFQVGERLPSTRELGRQLEASFHTVRKAYGMLVEEGLIKSEQGSGFIVYRQTSTLNKSERLEKGAEKLRTLLEELIGYGLDEAEIEEIFFEQLNYMEWPDRIQHCMTVAETLEIAKILAKSIKNEVGVRSEVIKKTNISKSVGYDALFVPLHLVNSVRLAATTREIVPIIYNFHPTMLLNLLEYSELDTVGLVTAEEDSIPDVITMLKNTLHFKGSFLAGTVTGKTLPHVVTRADVVVYSPLVSQIVEQKIAEKKRFKLEFQISPKSAEIIRSKLWDQ